MVHPPGPRGREVFGFFGGGSINRTLLFLESASRRYGPICSFRILHKRMYLVDDPELVKEVLVTRQHEFTRDSGATLLRELVGDGLLTREEPEHRERRRVLQPAFHRDQIAAYAELMVRESERVAEEWKSKSSLDVRSEMRRLTLSIVGAALFGIDFRDSAGQIARVLDGVIKKSRWLAPAFTLIEPLALAYRRFAPHGPSLFFRTERAGLEKVIAPIIERRRKEGGGDLLSLIMGEQNGTDAPLSDNDIRNEVVTFVLAGHETTSTALASTWYLLSKYPDVNDRLCAELDCVLGDRAATLDDVPKLKYTANVFKEAMRLYPPAVLFARRPKQRIELGGYRIDRGCSIFVSPYITQRNPSLFDCPDEFKPERWEEATPHKFAYFPFGAGAKMCIGESFARMEGVLVLASLARSWRLVREETGEADRDGGFALTANQGLKMRPEARSLSEEWVRGAETSRV